MGHYGDDFICWDVVNEAQADDGSGIKMKINGQPHIWAVNVPNYVDVAF